MKFFKTEVNPLLVFLWLCCAKYLRGSEAVSQHGLSPRTLDNMNGVCWLNRLSTVLVENPCDNSRDPDLNSAGTLLVPPSFRKDGLTKKEIDILYVQEVVTLQKKY